MLIPDWLRERWEMSDRSVFPAWYMDDPTSKQLRRIEWIQNQYDFDLNIMPGCKGQAADFIGMFELPSAEDLQVLKFFKVSAKGYSQTQAKHEAALLLLDVDNKRRWEGRAADALQKDFFFLFGIKLAKGMTYKRASAVIEGIAERWAEKEDRRVDEWFAYIDLLDVFTDRDSLEGYEIKKPSDVLLRKTVKEVRDSGLSIDHSKFIDRVLKRLVELKPELNRR